MDFYNYNGSIEYIVGLFLINDWEVVESIGINDFLNEFNEVYFGWRGFK